MAIIKSHTDLQQSKKLAEILPLESADMVYFGIHQGTDGKYYLSGTNTKDDVVPIYKNLCTKVFVKATKSDINCQLPCWSLAALLNIIPKHIKDYNIFRIDISENDTSIWYDEIGYGVNNNLPDITMESAIDACVGMILKLQELNLL